MKRLVSLSSVVLLATACAAQKSAPQSPATAGQDASPPSGAAGYPAPYGAEPGQPSSAPPPPPSQATTPNAEAPKPEPQPQAPPHSQSGRAVAINKAANDIEAAQRELDVAGSSCQNACRALGSMDRAAGHLCQLTREENTHDRCDDAKRRLYNARDRVRATCGSCPDNQPATDRNAPVPSMR